MTDHTPPTDQQLTELDALANAATPSPWCTDGWEIYQGAEYQVGAAWIGETCRGPVDSWEQDNANAAFAAAARAAVPALVAEIRRLRQQRTLLIDQLRRKDAASGAGDRALREFLAGPDGEEQPAAAEEPETSTSQCGARHHRYTETVCTEPASHYRRDVDSHAGPLILDGRQAGAAVWDEPAASPAV